MSINKIIFALLMSSLIVTAAYCQEKLENHLIRNVTGKVMSTDSVGSTISIRTEDQRQMAFVISDKAIITQETHTIGLMDIGVSSFVTIQYFISPSFKNTIVSIVDNEPVVNE